MKERNIDIDALKGMAILLVMIGHVLVWNGMTDGFIYDIIKVVQMPLFIIISGYLAGVGRRADSLQRYARMVGKRAVAYLVPFFFWIILLHPMTVLQSLKVVLFDLDEGLWFLMTLFILDLMVYTAQLAASFAGKRSGGGDGGRGAVFCGVYIILTAAVCVETALGVEFLSPGLTRLYIPFFMAGYAAGVFKEKTDQIPGAVKTAAMAAAFAALVFMAAAFDLQNVDTVFNLARQIAASFTGCYAVIRLLELLPRGRAKSFFAWLGGYTLEIYTLHFHFAYVLGRVGVYSLYSWQGIIYAAASFAVMSLITAVIIVITKKFWFLDLLLYGKTAHLPAKLSLRRRTED